MIKLEVDELTGRILGFVTHPIEPDDDNVFDMTINPVFLDSFLTTAAYLVNGEIVIKDRDVDDYHEKVSALSKQISRAESGLDFTKICSELFTKGNGFDDVQPEFLRRSSVVEALKQQRAQMVEDHEAALRQLRREKDAALHPRHYSGICLLIKDENEYLREWLDYHHPLGFDHVYIYDNGSDPPVSTAIPEAYRDWVTIIDWSGPHKHLQRDCYCHCLKHYGRDCRWIAYLDSDEFVRIESGARINEFLKEYEDHAVLYVPWVIYNAGGMVHKDSRPVRERFTQTIKDNYLGYRCGKPITQPHRTLSMRVHEARLKSGHRSYNERIDPQASSPYNINLPIVIDHYYTKSYEEWCWKMQQRGTSDPDMPRPYADFFLCNPDLEYLRDPSFPPVQKLPERASE